MSAMTMLKTTATNESATECNYAGGLFRASSTGVEFVRNKELKANDGESTEPVKTRESATWVCSPLRVVAATRNTHGNAWGRLIEWRDEDGKLHQWAMPLELLQGDGTDLRRELSRGGLKISVSRSARDFLPAYIQVWPVARKARCTSRLGWHGDIFMLPDRPIGEATELLVFQNSHAIEPAFSEAGSVSQWTKSVAGLAAGNSRLTFALCVGFAPPLIQFARLDNGIFHFVGPSSIGKTTALAGAASIWGPPSYMRSWHATVNGLEGVAALHNDGLLVLDELAQTDPRQAGEAVYLLGNGVGKARASQTGTALPANRWRVLVLSAGEQSLGSHMAQAERHATAGQEIRLANIEADAGAGLGLFENVHAFGTPARFAAAFKDNASRFYGAVGMEWLRRLVGHDKTKLSEFIDDGITQFCAKNVPPDASGQVVRMGRRFAICAVAGELATKFGLTGWREDEATDAVAKCFAAWLDRRGGAGNAEDRKIVESVRGFLQLHGSSRFEALDAEFNQRIPNRAGFWRQGEDGEREYIVTAEIFRSELCAGFDEKIVKRALIDVGILIPNKDGKPSRNMRLPGLGSPKVYLLCAGGQNEQE